MLDEEANYEYAMDTEYGISDDPADWAEDNR